MGHPCDALLPLLEKYSYAATAIRYITFFILLLAFIITSAASPADGQSYHNFGGLVGQLTCAVLCWLYVFAVVGSHTIAARGTGVDRVQELPASVRFAADLTFTMVCFIGSIAGAASINSDCILPPNILPASACYACPASDQLDPSVTDPGCKLQGGTPDGPYMCLQTCLHSFQYTIVTAGNGGTFGFCSFLMFMGTFGLAFSTILSFKDVRTGANGFEDVGDTYGPIGGAYAGGDAAESGKGSGITYQTDDAVHVPVANSHDL